MIGQKVYQRAQARLEAFFRTVRGHLALQLRLLLLLLLLLLALRLLLLR